MSSLWVDKYKPTTSAGIVGQSRSVARIKQWLKTYEPGRTQPLFLYGPPGVGKTTAAYLCCKELGYKTIEFNASDQRNKGIIRDVISTVTTNSRLNFTSRASDLKDAIILDEIDGMAGNEDRGGIAQLLIELKHAKKPMIFICNDGQHQKLRTLKDKCLVVEFKRPDYESIKMLVARIAREEKLALHKIDIQNLADSTDYDVRQIINSLCFSKDGTVQQGAKTTRFNAFEATKTVFSAGNKLKLNERFECFFSDYNIMPLFMFENYTKFRPAEGDHLKKVSMAANSLCLGDLADKHIRSNQNWSLLNTQALFSTVIPSALISSHAVGRVDFPALMGKMSALNKRHRLIQELNAHMCLKVRGGLDADYLEVFKQKLSLPLIKKDALGGIDAVVDFMYEYSLLREDFNSIMELAAWSFQPDPMSKVDSKTKTSFTLAYKKRGLALPYFHDEAPVKKKKISYVDVPDGSQDEEDDEEEEAPAVIKPKKVTTNAKKKKTAAEKKKEEKQKPAPPPEPTPPAAGSAAAATPAAAPEESQSQPEKRPVKPLGIARYFGSKKQKSS